MSMLQQRYFAQPTNDNTTSGFLAHATCCLILVFLNAPPSNYRGQPTRTLEHSATQKERKKGSKKKMTTAATVPVVCDPERYGTSLDQFFLFSCAIWVLMMQVGFAFLEAGTVSAKNATHVLFKNTFDIIIGAIGFFICGYAIAYGDGTSFIGLNKFFLIGVDVCDYGFYFFQYTFAAAATTIVSGAVAGRTSITAYVAYSIFVTSIVYPVIVHWTWTSEGWLSSGKDGIGYMDFAGSGVVHAVGGTCALVGIKIIGPRRDRIRNGVLIDLQPHSIPLLVLGGLMLVVGFFAFNAGSALSIDDATGASGVSIAIALVSTIMSAAGGGFCAVILHHYRDGTLNIVACINGMLAGAVASCAGADVLQPWAALVVGIVSGAVCQYVSAKMVQLGLDDACDAVAVHLGAGSWGVIARPLFQARVGVFHAWDATSALQLAWNIVGLVVIIAWSAAATGFLFMLLKWKNMVRVPVEDELAGHGGEHGQSTYYELESHQFALYSKSLAPRKTSSASPV
eukprot:m.335661 g.335661  ORF g.335661 m.335661 type:complete len:511 (-) comp16076_c0_seq46:183-1715(-)